MLLVPHLNVVSQKQNLDFKGEIVLNSNSEFGNAARRENKKKGMGTSLLSQGTKASHETCPFLLQERRNQSRFLYIQIEQLK